jgi:hypothetical protein
MSLFSTETNMLRKTQKHKEAQKDFIPPLDAIEPLVMRIITKQAIQNILSNQLNND